MIIKIIINKKVVIIFKFIDDSQLLCVRNPTRKCRFYVKKFIMKFGKLDELSSHIMMAIILQKVI